MSGPTIADSINNLIHGQGATEIEVKLTAGQAVALSLDLKLAERMAGRRCYADQITGSVAAEAGEAQI